MFDKKSILVLSLGLIGACSEQHRDWENNAPENMNRPPSAATTCTKYGYTEGTDEFDRCVRRYKEKFGEVGIIRRGY